MLNLVILKMHFITIFGLLGVLFLCTRLLIMLVQLYIKTTVRERTSARDVLLYSGNASFFIAPLALILLFYKTLLFVECALFYGHCLVSSTAVHMFFFILVFYTSITYTLTRQGFYKIAALLEYILLSFTLSCLLALLWFAGSFYSIFFILDCLNILIFLCMFSEPFGERSAKSSKHTKVVGAAVYYWASFTASVFLLLGALLLVSFFGTQDLKLFFVLNLLQSCAGYDAALLKNNLCAVLIVLGFFIKTGAGPMFVWKRTFFLALELKTLYIYMFLYFFLTFFYFTNIMLLLATSGVVMLNIIGSLFIVSGLLWVKFTVSFGLELAGFFVYSTAFNVLLVLGLLVSCAALL